MAANSVAPGKARAVSSASLASMVMWNAPRGWAEPANTTTTYAELSIYDAHNGCACPLKPEPKSIR